jgi:hypothetical protein
MNSGYGVGSSHLIAKTSFLFVTFEETTPPSEMSYLEQCADTGKWLSHAWYTHDRDGSLPDAA